MIPFHSVLPQIAQRGVRCIRLESEPGVVPTSGLANGNYAFVEFYCENLQCDCRRVFIQVLAQHEGDKVLASINCGWEDESFYREQRPDDIKAPREIVQGSLDPINTQSEHSEALLELFQQHVLDESYRLRMRRNHQLFREELRRANVSAANDLRPAGEHQAEPGASEPDDSIPSAHRQRFSEVAALLEQFGQKHLDVELTGFAIELWKRICRLKSPDCLRGKPTVWAASVTHVIARMNFLFDRAQPVHITLDTICSFFQANKTTVGSKATEIERRLRLSQHCEPGLCRREFLESFTNVRLANGMVLPWRVAREMGYVPADARVEELL